jgi:hypothetical protein
LRSSSCPMPTRPLHTSSRHSCDLIVTCDCQLCSSVRHLQYTATIATLFHYSHLSDCIAHGAIAHDQVNIALERSVAQVTASPHVHPDGSIVISTREESTHKLRKVHRILISDRPCAHTLAAAADCRSHLRTLSRADPADVPLGSRPLSPTAYLQK